MKATIRSEMKKRLKPLTKDYIDAQSTLVFNRLFDLPQFQSSTGVSIYLSMGGEVNTQAALRKSFELGKKVFIPKITGKNSADMFMLRVDSMDAINAFDKNAWGIPEPSMDIIAANHCGTYCGQIDLVLLPGVAFDKNCGRVGHGKGYYGKTRPLVYAFIVKSTTVLTSSHDMCRLLY